MSYKREVCEVSLDGGIQDRLWSGVTQRRPVLVEKIHQLFADHPGKENTNKNTEVLYKRCEHRLVTSYFQIGTRSVCQ